MTLLASKDFGHRAIANRPCLELKAPLQQSKGTLNRQEGPKGPVTRLSQEHNKNISIRSIKDTKINNL
jgi:hypothetical protein